MITTGLAEETILRGLLVGMLAVLVPGRLRIGSLDLPVAAYIVALMFGLAHWKSFTVDPFYQAMAQQIYAFVCGLIYRSEEHTSELQSLMRISYAVFCLKKKKKDINTLVQAQHHSYVLINNPRTT